MKQLYFRLITFFFLHVKSDLLILVSGNIVEYAEFNGAAHFLCFRQEKPFLNKFSQKNQNCQFKLKFGLE